MTNSEFSTHPVFQKLELLVNRLQEQEVIEKIEIEKQDFFKTACSFLSGRLKISVPALIPIAELNAVSTEFENALAQINSYLGNDNIGHVNNAVNNINSAVSYIKNFPILVSKGDFDFSKAAVQFQQTIQDKYAQTESIQNELETKLTEANLKIIENESELTALSDKLEEKEKEINVLNANFQAQFDKTTATYLKQIADDRLVFRSEIDTDREKIKTDTAAIIQDLERKLNEATKLVNVIGNVGVTGNYQNIANHHKSTANNWRLIAIGFMCLLSFLLIFSIWKVSDPAYDWHKAIIRIIAAAILIYPATYAARESSKHRKLENFNRRAELELAAINPFIEILDEGKKQQIKEKLVEKYFGNHIDFDKENEQDDRIPVNLLEKIIKMISSSTGK